MMNTTIKKRIEEINSGRVPERYEKTSFGIFPCDWKKSVLKDICEINPKTEKLPELFVYIDLESVVDGKLIQENIISKKNAPSRAQRVLEKNDVIYQMVRPYQKNNFIFQEENAKYKSVASTGYAQLRSKSYGFLYQIVNSEYFCEQVLKKCTGTNYPAINSNALGEIKVFYPKSAQEQSRIAEILMQWDKAIELQEKYIKQLELRKKALMQRLLTPKEGWKEQNLGMLSKIEKGEQVNNLELTETGCFPMLNGGVAPSGYYYKANCKANTITISEGGNSCGYVNYMTENFWSGGHCYTLSRVVIEKYYLFAYLKHIESKIMQMRVGSGLPNIQRSAIEKIKIYYPASIEEQKSIAEIFFNLDKIIVLQTKKLDRLIKQRKALQQYLLTGIVRV